MKLSQLIESFVISNDEFEDYLNRATEQLTQELQSGKNPRDAVHDLALTFADQHNKSYDAYTRMSDSLSARMHTLELDGSTSTEIAPADMTNGPDMSDMGDVGAPEMGGEPEMMTDPMGDMEMDVPAEDDMPGDSDMDDYSAVMDNKPEMEESYSPGDENEEGMVSNCCGAPIMDVYQGHGRCSDCKEMASAESVNEGTNGCADCEWIKDETDGDIDTCDECAAEKRKTNEASDADEKARQRAFAKADEPERGEKPKKVSLKKAPWEESVNESEKRWKQTSMSPAEAIKKYGKENVKVKKGGLRNGDDMVEVFVEGKYKSDAQRKAVHAAKAEKANESMEVINQIVTDKQASKLHGTMIDMFTASAIKQVYDKVNDENKAKLDDLMTSKEGILKAANIAMKVMKEGNESHLDEVLPAVGAVAGGVARAAMSKGIKGAVTRAGIKGVANKVMSKRSNESNADLADSIMRTSTRASFSEYNEFYKELDKAAKSGKKAGDTISVGGNKIKLKSNPKTMDKLSDAEMDKIDALALRLNEKGCSSSKMKR